jgi:hypothetical protein
MSTFFTILLFIQNNAAMIVQIQQGICFALSSLFQLLRCPKTSKFFGTFGVDGGRLIRWMGGLGLTAKPKSWLEFALKVASKFKASAALLLVALNVSACSGKPANAPTPVEVVYAAVNLTDTAIAEAIRLNPSRDWSKEVDAIDFAVDAARRRENVCHSLPPLQKAAVLVKCDKCVELITVAKETLSCPQ